MCETRTCQYCIAGHPRVRLTDETFAHEFQNPEHSIAPVAWCEPCKDSTRYEIEADKEWARHQPHTAQ
jgi:hypothetical protein